MRNDCVASQAPMEAPQAGTFGLAIYTHRAALGMTQAALAEAAGISAAYLSSIENERRPPPRDAVIDRLAAALGLGPAATVNLKVQGRAGRSGSWLHLLPDAPEHIRQYMGEVWEMREALSPEKIQQLRTKLRGAAM